MSALAVVHDAGDFMLSSFRDQFGAVAPIRETEARIEQIVAGLRAAGVVRWLSAAGTVDQALEVSRGVHTQEYLEFLAAHGGAAGPEVLEPRFAAPGVLPDTPVGPGAFAAAVRAGASAVAAANAVIGGESQVYAVCRPPGHHAGRGFLGGYCFLNNACLAAKVLQAAGLRVGVIDTDYHHGNGSADVLRDETDIPFVSFHASTLTNFPYHETAPLAANQAFVAFAEPPAEADYLARLADQLDRWSDRDVLVVSLGYDLVRGDPHGGWTMTPGFFRRLGRLFRESGRRLCVVQEGGYALDQLAECAGELARGLA